MPMPLLLPNPRKPQRPRHNLPITVRVAGRLLSRTARRGSEHARSGIVLYAPHLGRAFQRHRGAGEIRLLTGHLCLPPMRKLGGDSGWQLSSTRRTYASLGRVEERRGSLGHAATLRFLSPLIEPDVRFRIRLSDKTQVFALERL